METSFQNAFIEAIQKTEPQPISAGDSVVDIHGPLKHLTAFYERLRGLIDYQEERFIRRLAIKRILFRQLIIEGKTSDIGAALLRELIRAGYLENAKYPDRLGTQIDEVLKKYQRALPTLMRRYAPRDLISMQRRILGIAAAELEDLMNPPAVDEILIKRLQSEIHTYLPNYPEERTFIITIRALFKADTELTTWRSFGDYNQKHWQDFQHAPEAHTADILRELVKIEIVSTNRDIDYQIRRFARLTPPYIILGNLAQTHKQAVSDFLKQPEKLDQLLEELIEQRIQRSESKLHRSMVRATLYIFLTKVIFGIAVEVPYDIAAFGHIAYVPVIINMLIPPLLMFLTALSIRAPSQENTMLLRKRTRLILVDEPLPPLLENESRRYRSGVASTMFSLFYLATYLIAFGGLFWLLNQLTFSLVSMAIFIFFLSVVGFFAFRIRSSARELAVLREREGVMMLFFDFLALPFLRVGRRLAATVRQINIFLFVMDFIIEAPLKVVLVALEDWFAFLREKREELG